jgi:hypothetical protein
MLRAMWGGAVVERAVPFQAFQGFGHVAMAHSGMDAPTL